MSDAPFIMPPPVKPERYRLYLSVVDIECIAQRIATVRAETRMMPASPDAELRLIKMSDILKIVAGITGFRIAEIISSRQREHVVRARHIAIWLACRFTAWSYPHIGRNIGNRDHSTVISARKRVEGVVASLDRSPATDTPEAWAELLWSAEWPRRASWVRARS